jgi:hypothetical protein
MQTANMQDIAARGSQSNETSGVLPQQKVCAQHRLLFLNLFHEKLSFDELIVKSNSTRIQQQQQLVSKYVVLILDINLDKDWH